MIYINTKMGSFSAIGLGCLQTKSVDILKEAYKNGVNFFVTAEAYGDENQKLVADAFNEYDAPPFIFTKVGIYFQGANADEQYIQSREQINSSVKNCSALLGKKQLDFVGLHRLDDIHQFYSPEGNYVSAWEIALDELINLQEAGEIIHLGLSEPTAEQLEKAIAITKARGTSIAAIESAFSIVTRRAEINDVKAICDREGITFIAYTSVIRGLTDDRLQQIQPEDFDLTDELFHNKVFEAMGWRGDFILENVDMFSKENIKHNVKHMLIFQQVAAKYNLSSNQLSLAWIQHKGAFPIPGTNNLEHLQENIESVTKLEALESMGVFSELDSLFPAGTFLGDPNPLAVSKALDISSEVLNQPSASNTGLSL